MIRPVFPIILTVALVACALCHAQTASSCPNSKGYNRVHQIAGYSVQISPGVKASATDQCRASVTRSGGSHTIFARGWSLWIDDISGNDINQSGVPDVVFDTYTGNQGCCFEYTILSLGKSPVVVRKIQNQVPVYFRKQTDGSVVIHTGDGAFDLFMLSNTESVFPEVWLRLDGSELKDISDEFTAEYDEKIAHWKSSGHRTSISNYMVTSMKP
jgi:hypothetical protein